MGRLLINIFITDLFFLVENSDVCNFADDDILAFEDMSMEQIIKALQTHITKLREWFLSNGLLLNETKCQLLLIDRNINMKDHIKDLCKHAGKKT